MSPLLILFLLPHIPLTQCIVGGAPAVQLPNNAGAGVVFIDSGIRRKNVQQFCTGALITEQLVLSTGICHHTDLQCGQSTVLAGSTTPFEDGQLYFVVRYRFVESKTKRLFALVVLQLDRPVEISAYTIPYALPGPNNELNAAEQLFDCFGFGATSLLETERFHSSRDLRIIELKDMPEHSVSVCRESHTQTGQSRNLKYRCFGSVTDNGHRLMYGDMGAPVVGRKDRIVYAVAVTLFQDFEDPSFDFMQPHPYYFIDIKDAVPFILEAMGELGDMTN